MSRAAEEEHLSTHDGLCIYEGMFGKVIDQVSTVSLHTICSSNLLPLCLSPRIKFIFVLREFCVGRYILERCGFGLGVRVQFLFDWVPVFCCNMVFYVFNLANSRGGGDVWYGRQWHHLVFVFAVGDLVCFALGPTGDRAGGWRRQRRRADEVVGLLRLRAEDLWKSGGFQFTQAALMVQSAFGEVVEMFKYTTYIGDIEHSRPRLVRVFAAYFFNFCESQP